MLVPPAELQSPPPQAAPPQSAPAQSAPPADSKPYSVGGVRKALASDTPTRSQTAIDLEKIGQNRSGYGLVLESSSVTASSCSVVFTICQQLTWQSLANPTWNDQFLAMTGPSGYDVPFSGMNTSQRLQATASSIGLAIGFQMLTQLIHDYVVDAGHVRKQKKVEKVRTEIRAELAELERLNAAARASGQTGVR
jgi:hypothetical protein